MLWGLLGLAIPIAIHLLQLKRYKTIFFSDLRFLKNVQKSARKRHQIRHWILLALRMLAWGFLTIAFAMPFITETDFFQSRKAIAIYIDNSPSMMQKGVESPLWVQAKETAERIVRNNMDSEFLILTPSMEYAGQIKKSSAALLAIESIQPSSSTSGWKSMIQSLSTFNTEDTIQVYALTDGQSTSLTGLDSSDLRLELYPILFEPVSTPRNVGIDTAYFSSPVNIIGQNMEVEFSLTNYSNEEREVSLEFWINDTWKGAQSLTLASNESRSSDFAFQMDSEDLSIEIRMEDGLLDFDNAYYLSARSIRSKKVAHLYSQGYTQLRMDSVISDSAFQIDRYSYDQIPFGQLSQYDLIVADLGPGPMVPGLSGALTNAIESGSSLLFFTGSMDAEALSALGVAGFENERTDTVDNLRVQYNDPFYTGMFYEDPTHIKLPALLRYNPISSDYTSLGGSALLVEPNGSPSLVRYPKGLGQIYQWNAHPVRDHLGRTELYTAMLYQMAIFKESLAAVNFEIGVPSEFSIANSSSIEEPLSIHQDSLAVIPLQKPSGNGIELNLNPLQFSPGFASIQRSGDTLGLIALNTSRKESDLTALNEDEIETLLEQWGYDARISTVSSGQSAIGYIDQLGSSSSMSRWWIFGVLTVLILEMILWRQPKT